MPAQRTSVPFIPSRLRHSILSVGGRDIILFGTFIFHVTRGVSCRKVRRRALDGPQRSLSLPIWTKAWPLECVEGGLPRRTSAAPSANVGPLAPRCSCCVSSPRPPLEARLVGAFYRGVRTPAVVLKKSPVPHRTRPARAERSPPPFWHRPLSPPHPAGCTVGPDVDPFVWFEGVTGPSRILNMGHVCGADRC